MKNLAFRFLWIAFLSLWIQPALAQEMTKQDYLELSKKQKNTGFILLGGGAAAVIAGSVLFSENFCIWGCTNSEDALAATGAALAVGGGVAMLVSIPSFINSSKNATRAAQLSLVRETLPGPRIAPQIPRSYLSIQMSIPISKR